MEYHHDYAQVWDSPVVPPLETWVTKMLLREGGYAVVTGDAYSNEDGVFEYDVLVNGKPRVLIPLVRIPLDATERWLKGFGAGDAIGVDTTDTSSADQVRARREWSKVRWWIYNKVTHEAPDESLLWPGVPAAGLSMMAVSLTISDAPMIVLAHDYREEAGEIIFSIHMVDGTRRYDRDHVRLSSAVVASDESSNLRISAMNGENR